MVLALVLDQVQVVDQSYPVVGVSFLLLEYGEQPLNELRLLIVVVPPIQAEVY